MSGSPDPLDLARRATGARAAPWLVLTLFLVITGVATYVSVRNLDDREDDARDTAAATAADAVDRRLQSYIEVLEGLAGFFESSSAVSPEEFHRYVTGRRFEARLPGIESLSYAQRVPAGEVAAYRAQLERAIARSGLPYPPPAPFEPAPPGVDAYISSRLEGANVASCCANITAEPVRRATLLEAVRGGLPVATPPIELRVRVGDSRGIGIYAPVYEGTAVPPPPGLREQRVQGVVVASFRLGRLLRDIVPAADPRVDLELYDNGQLAYDAGPAARTVRDDETRTRMLDIAGRRWTVLYRDGASPLGAIERRVPWAIAVGGTLVALLAAALLRTLTSSRRRAYELALDMTRELHERERDLARSNAELGHFAYLASHDLQEPLRTITSYTSLLEQRLGTRLDDRERGWLGFIRGGAEHMSRLISDLLEYSRTGVSRTDAGPVDLGAAWDIAERNLASAIAESGASVERGRLPVVDGREREIVSLLQNLLGNAIKYRRPDIPPVVRVKATRKGDVWEIAVTDNGIGIDPRFHDRVFGLFQRLHTTDEYPGTGMGLAIVRKLADANGGGVRVESAPGGGSTFVLELPATGPVA